MIPATRRLVLLADTFCAVTGQGRGSVSNRIFSDGKRIDVVDAGADLQTRSYERALRWFSDNWPEGTDWPAGVERPEAGRGAAEPAGQAAAQANGAAA